MYEQRDRNEVNRTNCNFFYSLDQVHINSEIRMYEYERHLPQFDS